MQLILSDPAAAASATQVSDEQIPYSKRELNAVAVAYENAVGQLQTLLQQAVQENAISITDANSMYSLLTQPTELNHLLPIVLTNLEQTQGGWDLLSQHVDAIGRAKFQMQQQPMTPQQQAMMQQQAMQPPMMQQQPMQPTTYSWGDGQIAGIDPRLQMAQPGLPQQQGFVSSAQTLGNVPPDQQWMVIDQADRNGEWRNKMLIQP